MDTGHRSRALALALTAALAACGAEAYPPAAPDARRVPSDDSGPIDQCEDQSATLGRCQLEGSGEECTGVPDESRLFVELGYGDSVTMVRGPQGAWMFVLALQTDGIVPGDPDNPVDPSNPDVDIILTRNGYELSRYRGTPGFTPSAAAPDALEAAGLFVILDGNVSEVIDSEVVATAKVVDADGTARCGQVMFVASQ